MSGAEVTTRMRQEVGKRLDVVLSMAGRRPGAVRLGTNSATPGRFFFSPHELPERLSLLRRHLPLAMEALIHEADQICQHRFSLVGYTNLDFSAKGDNPSEIDWHRDAVHGIRTPLIPWYKINFLDFTTAGDHKIVWELNRHQHLVTLAKAWLLTGNVKYASEALSQWYSWQKANPYPLGINWASSLEVAFRSISWLWMQRLLQPCPVLPAHFNDDLQRALALHARHIERYLSTYFSPNTHLLGEALALFFIGTLSPQLPHAERWKTLGWKILQEESERQVRPDGVYFEHSFYYHVYACDFFLHARLLATRNGISVPSRFDDVIRKMLAMVHALAQAGPPDGFGDDDGGRLFDPHRNRAEHLPDPLVTGAALWGDESLRRERAITEEAVWLLGHEAIPVPDATERDSPQSYAFPDAGLYIQANSHPIPQRMVINAGPRDGDRTGHGHADALSISLSFAGRPWLVDAGTFVYTAPGSERQTFRGTDAHNTLTIDEVDQAQPAGPFAWSSLPKTDTECWVPAATFTLFAGSHSGYERLSPPVRHRRFVFCLHGNLWLVRDVVESTGSHLLQAAWHFAADLEVHARENSFIAFPQNKTAPASAGHSRLTLLPVPDPQWKCELVAGKVSPAYGIKVSAPILRCTAKLAAPAEHAMLLIPSTDAGDTTGTFTRLSLERSIANRPAAVYSYDTGLDSHRMAFRDSQSANWTFGAWTTDASFLYFCVRDRKVSHLVCCNASFLHLHAEPVFRRKAPLQYLEWTNWHGERRALSSDEAVCETISVQAIESAISL